jgi:hypothetical protein
MKTIHIKLPDKRRNISMFEVLSNQCQHPRAILNHWSAYARTLENSGDGDMTKLSFELDHEMRLCMERSSSMLLSGQLFLFHFLPYMRDSVLVKFVYESCLNDFWLLR